ncbi:hypothetical protein FACS189442_4080 [Spirochaetia bacterium]|nr:hypothetical protein FACS189442_4080 [Spirochaetia bacterium]
MHSRDGLETVYMGDEWKQLVRSSAAEAKKLGLEAWLYDEDRWPSGTAGGQVPAIWGDDSRCKGLTLEVCVPDKQISGDKTILALYGAQVEGMEIFSLRRLKEGERPRRGEKLLVGRLEISGKSEWFNGEAPPDNLNPQSVRHFIEATHQVYKNAAGDFFGSTIPGIFTDEPSIHDRHASFPANRGWIPWTNGFGNFFMERRGYDPLDIIPFLYFNGEKSAKIRHDYWRTITERYAESYSGEIGSWCRANGIAYTGHFLQEDKLGLSARVNGAVMPHYYYQDVPGIDILFESTGEYLTVKQCTSVAHQYGKPVVLSESYGCTGWEFSFEGQKWVGDWQYVLGVNRLVKHMALYTLKGCGKRDYPPSFNYNNGWWQYDSIIEDYFGRISSVLTEGVPVRDVAVLHPAATAWSRLGCNPYGNPVRRNERDVPAIDQYGNEFNAFLKYLSGIHYDYDLADELLIARDGKTKDQSLIIARAVYKVLILPPVDTLLMSTVSLIGEFLGKGGFLIAVRPLPFMIEGERRDDINSLFNHKNVRIADNFFQVESLLESCLKRMVSITGGDRRQDTAILYLLEDMGEAYSLFIVNNDRNAAHNVSIDWEQKKTGYIKQLNPLSGKVTPQILIDGAIRETLGPADSRLYLIEKNIPEIPAPELKPVSPEEIFYASFSPESAFKRTIPNALTLDTCCYRFNNKDESEEMEVWQAQAKIREQLGMMQISHNGLLQRYKWVDKVHPNDGEEVILIFRFTAAFPFRGTELVLEDADNFRIILNGKIIPNQSSRWFLDRGFECIPLPSLITGENRLELICNYKNNMQMEDIYIIGDFAVNQERSLIPEPSVIRTGDWTLQGYPHYAGSLIYTWHFLHTYDGKARIILKLEQFTATTILLEVNEHSYSIPWKAAAAVDITEALLSGKENRISLELAGGMRNLLGPFHTAQGKVQNTNDASFRTLGTEHIDGYNLHPYGLYAPPKLYLKPRINA